MLNDYADGTLSYMEGIFIYAILVFWLTILVGSVVTAVILPLLTRWRLYRTDRKMTMYGTEATEFNAIRSVEEQTVKKNPVPRMGGLTILPTLFGSVCVLAAVTDSAVFWICAAALAGVSVVAVYDDLIDVGVLRRKRLVISHRLFFLWLVAVSVGYGLQSVIPEYVTFLPFGPFNAVPTGGLLFLLFAFWFLFWQLSSIIDGIDGLSGSVFFVLFLGTGVLSGIQGHSEALLLSAVGAGVLIPWLFINYAPAKAYLTETGITALVMLFSLITFLLAAGENPGNGLWFGLLSGAVLIMTWFSNILQLLYRKKTGKKLFRIAPIHHHFEAGGIPGSAVVSRYMLVTILCVLFALTFLFFAVI